MKIARLVRRFVARPPGNSEPANQSHLEKNGLWKHWLFSSISEKEGIPVQILSPADRLGVVAGEDQGKIVKFGGIRRRRGAAPSARRDAFENHREAKQSKGTVK